MGRHTFQMIDRAEQLDELVHKLADETNQRLRDSQLYDVTLAIREPFEVHGKKYFNGFVGMHIRFDQKEPQFLTEDDKQQWYSRMREVAERRFGIDTTARNLDWITIGFEEPSEEELYVLTPNKEVIFRGGFERAIRYIGWYQSAVESYQKVIQSHSQDMKKCLGGLEAIS